MNLDLFDEIEVYFKQNGIDCFKDENKVNEFLKYILGEGGKFALKAAK